MAAAQETVLNAMLAAIASGLRIVAIGVAVVSSCAAAVVGSGALCIPLDRTLQTHGGKDAGPGILACLGMALGFMAWFVILGQSVNDHLGIWDNLIYFATAPITTIVFIGALSLICWTLVHIVRWIKKAAKKRQAGAEHVELSQARNPSELERMVGAEDGMEATRGKTEIA